MNSRFLGTIAAFAGSVFRALEVTGGIMLLLMMLVTTVDVVGRYFLGHSLRGSVEMTQLLLVAVIFLALPHLNWLDAHINVDLMPLLPPAKWEWVQNAVITLISLLAFVVLLPKAFALHARSVAYGDATEFLRVPMHYPLKLILAMLSLSAVALALRLVLIVLTRGAMPAPAPKGH